MTSGATFLFDKYHVDWEARTLSFTYKTIFRNGEMETYTEQLVLPPGVFAAIPDTALSKILETIHLMLGVSYYKQYCPENIEHPYTLQTEDALFWETVYVKGLGEFAYRNNLRLNGRVRFASQDRSLRKPQSCKRSNRTLVGVGGGKESAVSIELLKEEGIAATGFIVETHVAQQKAHDMCAVAGINTLTVRRILDPLLLTKRPGVFNGHVPVSAIYASIGILCAALYDYAYVTVGNEASSNFGNIEYDGFEVNHQWSKSSEFELLFRAYTRRIWSDDIVYFSLLRPFHELRIAQQFALYETYFDTFASCNKNFVIDASGRPQGNWCGTCAKCAFVFLMLSPWIERARLISLFAKDLLDDVALIPMYRDLTGHGSLKPFDCVGSFDEAQVAFSLIAHSHADTVVVKSLQSLLGTQKIQSASVLETHPAPLVPTPFVFCGMRSIGIVGYGKEGVETEKYLRSQYPRKEITIFDDTHELKVQDAHVCDCAVRSPGVPYSRITTQSTTATNMFFAHYKDRNIIVGVTGSKGKSTTASLIHHILQASGKKSVLLGNVGSPMLAKVTDGIDADTIIVLELSSYQLEDIQYAPHIAVVTSLFPDHIPHHGSLAAYYDAKRNILLRQRSGDVAILPESVAALPEWSKAVQGVCVIPEELPIPLSKTQLIGTHNESNMTLAFNVATHLGVPKNSVIEALQTFTGLPHRLECVGTYRGVTFYDDAIATTPEATLAALHALGTVETIFLGGDDRGYDFSELEAQLATFGVKNVVLFPHSGNRIVIDEQRMRVLRTEHMRDAVQFAYQYTGAGGVCLLSCASPSYSLWKNFEEKGDEFKREVTKTHSGFSK